MWLWDSSTIAGIVGWESLGALLRCCLYFGRDDCCYVSFSDESTHAVASTAIVETKKRLQLTSPVLHLPLSIGTDNIGGLCFQHDHTLASRKRVVSHTPRSCL